MLIGDWWRSTYVEYKPSPLAAYIPRSVTDFIDDRSGAQFKSNLPAVQKAFKVVNSEIEKFGHAPLNLLYDELDIPTVLDGDRMRWHSHVLPLFKYVPGRRIVRLSFNIKPEDHEAWEEARQAVKNLQYLQQSDGPWQYG